MPLPTVFNGMQQGPHDLGGALRPGGEFEALDPTDKKWKFWERQCHGVVW
jgi:hypothetical protein